MLQNLAQRNLQLLSIHDYPTVEAQRQRFLDLGLSNVISINLNEYWDTMVEEEEKKRVARCEILDEQEEFRLFGSHYCVVYASK